MTRLLAVGDNVVDCYPASNQMFPGGNCLNVSVFARRFGAETGYIGAIGQDVAGEAIRAALVEEGVRIDRLRILPGSTAYCVIGHRRNGDRVFLKFDLSVSMFEPNEADVAFAAGFDAVHIGQSSGLDAHLHRFAARTRLSYDFSTRREADHRRTVAPLCFLASISAGDLGAGEARALLQDALDAGAQWCLVTRGEEGAMLGNGDRIVETPAHRVEVVDTLGAGDTFVARALVGLLRGEAPDDLMRAAARAAAETCSHVGAIGHASAMSVDAGEIPLLEDAG